MNEARQTQMLAGHTALARKVFEVVPIQMAWPTADIHGALRNISSSSAQFRAVRACLGELKDQGLIREVGHGFFQRHPVTTKQPKSEPIMSTQAKPILSTVKPAVSALDALASLSSEVVSLSEEFGQRMKKLAMRLDEVALSVEVERESNAEAMVKFKQFQDLLKGIAQ